MDFNIDIYQSVTLLEDHIIESLSEKVKKFTIGSITKKKVPHSIFWLQLDNSIYKETSTMFA